MAKGELPAVELNPTTARNKTKTSVAQKAAFANKSSNSKVGGTSNAIASGRMQTPLMDPNKLKIGKKKKMRGR